MRALLDSERLADAIAPCGIGLLVAKIADVELSTLRTTFGSEITSLAVPFNLRLRFFIDVSFLNAKNPVHAFRHTRDFCVLFLVGDETLIKQTYGSRFREKEKKQKSRCLASLETPSRKKRH
jgi:hypothetical protein